MGTMLSPNTKTDPYKFAESIKKKELKGMLDSLTNVLLTTYVCCQYGFYIELNQQKASMIEIYGKPLAEKLGFTISDKYNEPLYVWTRQNIDNYRWMHTIWVALNKKYYDIYNEPHPGFKYSVYLPEKNLFLD